MRLRNVRSSLVLTTCLVLFLYSACGSSPQRLILGTWEAESAVKVTAEFRKDGTATLTMFGQTLQGTYKLNGENELEWTLNGRTTKNKVSVTPNQLEVTGDTNLTVKYRREYRRK